MIRILEDAPRSADRDDSIACAPDDLSLAGNDRIRKRRRGVGDIREALSSSDVQRLHALQESHVLGNTRDDSLEINATFDFLEQHNPDVPAVTEAGDSQLPCYDELPGRTGQESSLAAPVSRGGRRNAVCYSKSESFLIQMILTCDRADDTSELDK